jgi:hypothetical protein
MLQQIGQQPLKIQKKEFQKHKILPKQHKVKQEQRNKQQIPLSIKLKMLMTVLKV